MKNKSVAIIGAGAAGCMCAAELSRRRPELEILVFEKGASALAKVAVTGGGRCNLTNTFENIDRLEEAYPRGARLMKRLLGHFSQDDCRRWFEDAGVRLVVQDDGCVFPASQDAMEVVATLRQLMRKNSVKLFCNSKISSITRLPSGQFMLRLPEPFEAAAPASAAAKAPTAAASTPAAEAAIAGPFDAVVVTSGGATSGLLLGAGLETIAEVPSLFTLKITDAGLWALMGTVVENCRLSLVGTRFCACGTLLITDWGVSGPATLKLSSYAARHLAENGYKGWLSINWTGCNQEEAASLLKAIGRENPRKMTSSARPCGISDRLWRFLLGRARVREDLRWAELGPRGAARLCETLINDTYEISGRARFKEEFVTCGGLSLSELNPDTLESKRIPGLYAGGEVIDIDAITGGFNLQAAWSSGFCIAESISDCL